MMRIMIIYQAFSHCQLARKFLMTRWKDSEWPNPNVHFINSLKAAKQEEGEGIQINSFTGHTMYQTVYWALRTSWQAVAHHLQTGNLTSKLKKT